MKSFDTLSEAIFSLKNQGYTNDFNLHPEWIECPPLKVRLTPEEFHVDQVHRFEGMSSTDDNAILFAVSTSSGLKGILVDAYGPYAESLSPIMVQKLTIDSRTNL